MYIKDFAVGDKVVVIKTREELPEQVTAPEKLQPKRNVAKIIENIVPFIDDSIEQAELHTAIKYLMRAYGEAEVEFLLHTIYQYGKTAGVRQERQRKKTLSEEKI